MRFRPCIDIHNGKVKQLVGSSLTDSHDRAEENFVSEQDGAWYARFYGQHDLSGGHVILLNPASSPYYKDTRKQALGVLHAAPGLWQIGGGITRENASSFLEAGASHVIVTSYVFRGGMIDRERLASLAAETGKDHLVLDLSCRKREDGRYYIMTDRWQKFTDEVLSKQLLTALAGSCDEFLVHAVDVEGKQAGPDRDLVRLLSSFDGCPVTYAGGLSSLADLALLEKEGQGKLDFTIGSALDLFGGSLPFEDVLAFAKDCRK